MLQCDQQTSFYSWPDKNTYQWISCENIAQELKLYVEWKEEKRRRNLLPDTLICFYTQLTLNWTSPDCRQWTACSLILSEVKTLTIYHYQKDGLLSKLLKNKEHKREQHGSLGENHFIKTSVKQIRILCAEAFSLIGLSLYPIGNQYQYP